MTTVFSGGLVYKYSNGSNGYGLMDTSDGAVSTTDQYKYLKEAYVNTASPCGDRGAITRTASTCPTESSDWYVSDNALPAMPTPAKKYITNRAVTGPGLDGSGYQEAGAATTGSDAVTYTVSSGPPSTAAVRSAEVDMGAFGVVAGTLVDMLGGMTLL
ncbi:hypothetical protein DSL72_001469 [Monilinia vaccinii-corymbosi]|uniref:1,3-beta-glucanosyltransferase n=1 Tax=Monilinia vaccinii-corymbosi TaxID=61207 RepID=A0A8A3P4X4_9HELO|nr:hypothetical protein DSL72_001469 [Monilinia vaccinii-corymbosi]